MKTFLKTLIGGALGLSALYVVGKVCFEAGKDVAEIERQLEHERSAEKSDTEDAVGDETSGQADTSGSAGRPTQSDPVADVLKAAQDEMSKAVDEAWEKNTTRTRFGKFVDKVRNAKMFVRVKKSFEKGDRSPGILGSLLSNPDGARIEAFVRNGGVQINVTPRAA